MKRKLIDLKDSTFDALSLSAASSGVCLKRYIEDMLDDRARVLEDGAVCQYRLSSSKEPSERELSVIMNGAAMAAERRRQQSMATFFEDIRQAVKEGA